MFKNISRWWKTRALRRANRRLKYHYDLVRKYLTILSDNLQSGNHQESWDIILLKLPRSIEEISLTLKCGDYWSYRNYRQWNFLFAELDCLDFYYGHSILTNTPIPNDNIYIVLCWLTFLMEMHSSLLPKYQPQNRNASF